MGEPTPSWWAIRPARNLDAKTYRCPFCGRLLASLSEHVLITPEGDARRRRHAHAACAAAARRRGDLPSRDEWRATQPHAGVLARIRGLLRR